MLNNNNDTESEDIEIRLLLEAIFLKYGADFRGYSRLSVKRQILRMVSDNKLANISELQHKMIWDGDFFQNLLPKFSINVTEHFRDPTFYKYFREDIIPVLRTYPSLKIWHAGCASGQEVYSLAILLEEEKLYHRTQIYATDINTTALNIAKEGTYSNKEFSQCSENYVKAGGTKSFSEYVGIEGQNFVMDKSIKNNISFFDHNLVTDQTFVEAHVILCRNVLIYFDEDLTTRVVNLFYDSLQNHGFLCLGSRERIMGSNARIKFKLIDSEEKVYRRYPSALAGRTS